MRMVLKNNRRVNVLKSDLHAIICRGALDMSQKALPSNPSSAVLETHAEMKCNLPSAPCAIGTFGIKLGLARPSQFVNS